MNIKFYDVALDDKNQVEMPAIVTSGVDVVGCISAPRGDFVIDTSANVFVSPGQFILMNDGTFNVIARIMSAENFDGVHMRVQYEIDWLRTYYNYFLTVYSGSDSKVKALSKNSHMLACSNNTDWLKWYNAELPVTGNYITSTSVGNDVDRVTSANTSAAYLVIYKCYNRASAISTDDSPGVTAVLFDHTNLEWFLRMLSAGDYDGNLGDKYRPSILLTMIAGVYFLPGVSVNTSLGTTTMSGVNTTKTGVYIEWFDPDANDIRYLDGVTGKVLADNTSGARDVVQIAYQTTGNFAKYSFTHNLTITLDDFRDLYYKSYKMFAPYIGQIDVPVKLLCSYGSTTETLTLGFDYIFNIYEGSVSYKWTALPGLDVASWHALPQVPLSTSESQFIIQQNNEKLALSNISSVVAGVAGAATRNAGAVVNAVMTGGSAIAQTDIANNAAAAGNVRTTSQSGFEGYSISTFYLTIVETEIAADIDDYSQIHGYATYTDVQAYNVNFKMWLDAELWQPETGFAYDYVFQNHAGEIKAQLDRMEYIYIKGV